MADFHQALLMAGLEMMRVMAFGCVSALRVPLISMLSFHLGFHLVCFVLSTWCVSIMDFKRRAPVTYIAQCKRRVTRVSDPLTAIFACDLTKPPVCSVLQSKSYSCTR